MTIDFFNRDGSPAATKVERYPGGEYRIDPDSISAGEVAVVRGADPAALVILAVWAHDIWRIGGNPIGFIPYLPAARADHDEHPVGFDAAAYARLINAAELDHVVCVDPHSSVMPELVDRCEVIEAADLIEPHTITAAMSLAGVIIPDAGARERVALVADQLELPTYQAHKQRDFDTGHLSGFICEQLPDEGSFLVVDDICDGGGTFRGLAQAAGVERERMHLWVTHGVFSGSAPDLLEDYSTITTTDSHPGCRNIDGAQIVPLLPHLLRRITAA